MKNKITFCFQLLIFIILQKTVFSQSSNWILKNPYPQAFDLNSSAVIPGSNTLLAIGKVGTIILTPDEGTTWVDVSQGVTGHNLNDISFGSNTTGFVVGDSGVVLKTTNTGYNWNSINANTNLNLISTYFINSDTGFIVCARKVLKTSDGGNTWASTSFNFNLHSIFFSSNNVGYIAADSGRVVKTIDGGINWAVFNSGIVDNLVSINLVNDTLGFVGSNNGKILKTTNGGQLWTLSSSLSSYSINDINFINENIGFVINNYKRYITTNGGTSWTEHIANVGFSCKSISFKDNSIGYIVGGGGIILKSQNGGGSWEYIVGTNSFIYDMDCSFNKCFAVGSGGLLSSTDFGESWISDPLTISGNVVKFINDTIGFIGGSRLLRTRDGGAIWDTVSLGTTDTIEIRDVFFNDNTSTGFFFGDKMATNFIGQLEPRPVVFKTIDSGLTWIKVFEGNPMSMTNMKSIIFFNNGMNGFIFSQMGSNLVSIDGGNSWSIDSNTGISGGTKTSKVNNLIGYVSCNGGSIYKTINGGNSWNIVGSQYLAQTDIHFLNDSIGYAPSNNGKIYKTINSGINWNLVHTFPNNSTSATRFISFIKDSIGFVYGGSGIILKNIQEQQPLFCTDHYSTSYDSIQNNFTLTVDSATTATTTSYYWDFGDGTNSILATPSHTYLVDTLYNVCMKTFTILNDSCMYCHIIGKDTTGNIIRTTGFTLNVQNTNTATGIFQNNSDEIKIVVYPNPFNSQTTILFNKEMKNTTVKIIDILSKKINEINFTGKQLIIEKGSLEEGIYFLQIVDENKNVENRKIIIQ